MLGQLDQYLEQEENYIQHVSLWGDIPSDIGHMILAKLHEIAEHIIFGAVCKQWYIISKEYTQELPKSISKVLPMLLVPSAKFISPRLYGLSCLLEHYPNFKLPYTNGRYNGSSYGWIVIENQEDRTVTLIHPFGREIVTIHLPAFMHQWASLGYYGWEVHKLFIMPDSTKDDYTIVAIYEGIGGLATIKSGEMSWVYIPPQPEMRHASFFSDIILYQGAVYAVSTVRMVVKVDVQARPPVLKVVLPDQDQKKPLQKTYLVESTSSELYLLQRMFYERHFDRDIQTFVTVGFNLQMLKVKEEKGELIYLKDLKSLKGDTFFVGDSTSIAVRAKSCMPNSIYFTDDHHKLLASGPLDLGYYNGSIGYYYEVIARYNGFMEPVGTRPFWIVPHQRANCDFTSPSFFEGKSSASLRI